jgi:hypothetical protein
MKNLIVTKYHGPTDTKGSRISVRGFVPGKGIISRVYTYDHGARSAHDSAAAQFLGEYFPGSTLDEARLPEYGKTSTGNAYAIREPLPEIMVSALRELLRKRGEDCEMLARQLCHCGDSCAGMLQASYDNANAEREQIREILAREGVEA